MIAITFALTTESAATAALLRKRRRETIEGRPLILGELAGRPVALVHTGVGATVCRETVQRFFETSRPDSLIASGFAGAVVRDLEVGDLVFAENFCDRDLLLRARGALGHRAAVRRLYSAENVIASIDERTKIARAHDAGFVDMETATIAEACAAALVPMLAFRVISDTPDELFPLPPTLLFDISRQRTDFLKLSGHLLRRPTAIPKLLRFGRRMREVSGTLAHALAELVREMP